MIRFAFSICEGPDEEVDWFVVYMCDGEEITGIAFMYDSFSDEVFDVHGKRADADAPKEILQSGIAPVYCCNRLDYVFDASDKIPKEIRNHLKDATFRILETIRDQDSEK